MCMYVYIYIYIYVCMCLDPVLERGRGMVVAPIAPVAALGAVLSAPTLLYVYMYIYIYIYVLSIHVWVHAFQNCSIETVPNTARKKNNYRYPLG